MLKALKEFFCKNEIIVDELDKLRQELNDQKLKFDSLWESIKDDPNKLQFLSSEFHSTGRRIERLREQITDREIKRS